tara:strand:- start:2270 stop:2602 length:333 start_codon:yes stop_codon:yes gene_type:complete
MNTKSFEVTVERLEHAMEFLALTDIPAAQARGKVKALEQYGKTVKAMGFLEASGTVAEREAKSLVTEEWKAHVKRLEEAVIEAETLENQRASATGVKDVWRTLQANQRGV